MGASRIKGITIEIDGNTTGLQDSLKDVNKQISKTQSNLKDVNKLLKMDPGNTELLAQKQSYLADAVQSTREKLVREKEALEQLRNAGNSDDTIEQQRALEREIADTEQSLKGLTKQMKDFGSVSAQQIALAGEKMKEVGDEITSVGEGLTKSVTAPILGVGAAAYGAWTEVDAALDTVAKKTGATGDALKDLQKSVSSVAESIPTSFENAGIAIGEVNTRFGLTGDALENLSEQFIKFAEINDTDLNTAIDSTDRILKQFGLGAESANVVMGLLTSTSQKTGLEMGSLMSTLESNGATLRSLNMDLTTSVSFLASLESNGISSSEALGALTKAAANMQKQGKDVNTEIKNVISAMSDGEVTAEDYQKAVEVFGAKAANSFKDMAASGRLSMDVLGGELSDYADVINTTFNDTLDPIDQMTVTMNTLKSVGADLFNVIMEIGIPILQALAEKARELKEWWGGLSESQQELVVKIAGIAAAVGPVLMIVGKVVSTIGTLMTAIPAITGAIGTVGAVITGSVLPALAAGASAFAAFIVPILPIVAAIGAVIGIGVLLYKNWDTIKEKAGELKEKISEGWNNIKEKTSEVWNNVKEKVSNTFDTIKSNASERLNNIKKAFVENGGGIKGTVAASWTAVKDNFASGFNVLNKLTGGKLGEIMTAFRDKFKEIATGALDWGKDIIGNIAEGITNGIKKVKDAVTNVANTIKEFLHFSEPDRGPLADFNTWMPDMMNQMASQIEAGRSKVQTAIAGVAGDIATPMASNTTLNYGGTTIVVNGAPGQDVQELAEIVMDRINTDISQKEAVFA